MQTTVEVGAEFLVRRTHSRGQGAHDQLAPCGKQAEAVTAQVPEPALDTVSQDGVADGSAHHEPDPGRRSPAAEGLVHEQVHHDGAGAGPAAMP